MELALSTETTDDLVHENIADALSILALHWEGFSPLCRLVRHYQYVLVAHLAE